MKEPKGVPGLPTTDVGKVYHFGPRRQAFRLALNLRTGRLFFSRVKSLDGKATW